MGRRPYRPGEARRANDARARELRGRPSGPIHRDTPGIEAILTAGDRLVGCARPAAQHGLVHKDIKPSNVLINSATGQVLVNRFRYRFAPSTRAPGTKQTGRMNRSIDSRSDLYTFGIMLYQMLTRDLPFSASDPMGGVHCHVAKQPVPPNERLKNVPGPVSAIIMKLLAQTPRRALSDGGWRGRSMFAVVLLNVRVKVVSTNSLPENTIRGTDC